MRHAQNLGSNRTRHMHNRTAALLSGPFLLVETLLAAEQPSVTRGRAETIAASIYECDRVPNARVAALGRITGQDGTIWSVPAAVNFASASKASDLYNECIGVTPKSLTEVRIDTVPVVEVDPDGEVITGYLLADNYFELYVNGKLIAVDAVPFTPFNSAIVRFRAKRPVTYAVKLVDWEEHLGLGTEKSGAHRQSSWRWRFRRPIQRRHDHGRIMESANLLYRTSG
jgi:hypothetical protein